MEDKKFYKVVYKRLFKERRFSDLFNLTDRGYYISKLKDGKFDLGLSSRKQEDIVLTLDEHDTELGYELVKLKHSRGKYEKLNKENKYTVTVCKIDAGEKKLKLAVPELWECNLETFRRKVVKDGKLNAMMDGGVMYAIYKKEIIFDSHEDFLEFNRKGYRVIEENDESMEDILKRRKNILKQQIEELEKELKYVEEYESKVY